jgi:hypothetical protein
MRFMAATWLTMVEAPRTSTSACAGGSTGRVVLRGYVSNPGARALVSAVIG